MPFGVWRSGLGCRARLCVVGDASRSTLALFEPIAVAVHLEDVDVVGEPVEERAGQAVPDPDWGRAPLDARKTRLVDVLEDVGVKTLKYLYDFGDGWEHTIKVEHIADAMPGVVYPRLIDVTGRCPPEDIGGPCCYGEFLEAIADPKHVRHAELAEWTGDAFDPDAVDTEGHANAIAALARQWSRKPAVKRKRAT
jgi:hypothetical protein